MWGGITLKPTVGQHMENVIVQTDELDVTACTSTTDSLLLVPDGLTERCTSFFFLVTNLYFWAVYSTSVDCATFVLFIYWKGKTLVHSLTLEVRVR
jgi:hypothetical protein